MACQVYHYFFRNLANPLKTKIISELKQKPMTVTELSKKINAEQSKLSHALLNLKTCSLVNSTSEGKKRIYSLNKNTLIPILKIIDEHKDKYCKKNCKIR